MKHPITFWYSVPRTYMVTEHPDGSVSIDESRLVEMKASGMTLINGDWGKEGNCLALKACEALDLRMAVIDHRITQALHLAASGSLEACELLVREIVADYTAYPALWGYHIMDEPNNHDFEKLRILVELFRKYDPTREAYINLFPNYATPAQLACPTYREHVDTYLSIVRPTLLSYDHYHFLGADPTVEKFDFANERDALIYASAQQKKNRGGYFDNLEVIRELAQKYRIPFMLIVLLVEHGPYRYLTEAEIRFEVFSALAYGAAITSYFTYWTPEYEPVWKFRQGMISENGCRTPHYDDVCRINQDLAPIGAQLQGHRSLAVCHVGEEHESVTPFVPNDTIREITGGKWLLGLFDDGLCLIVNKDYTHAATATLTLCGRVEAFDTYANAWIPLPTKDSYSLSLGAGDAALLRIHT